MKAKMPVNLLLCGLLLTGMLAGCAPSGSDAGSASGNSDTPKKSNVTLSYAASRTWVNRNSNIDDDLNKQFQEETGIQIDFQISPDDQYTNVLQTKLSTGEIPDIFMASSGLGILPLKPEKYFADLSEEEWVERYVDYAKRITLFEDKTVGFMTWCVDGYAVLYNPEIYAKYKLEPPTDFESFKKVSDTLLQNGITPIFEPGKELWHWGAILGQVGPLASKAYDGNLYADLNADKVKLADIPILAAFLDDMKYSYDAGYFGENSFSNSWDSAYEAMASGKYAGIITYESWQTELAEKYPDIKAETWEMYPVPFADNNMYSPSASAIMRVAYKDSKNLNEVKEFFNFLARPENLQSYYDNSPALRPNPSFKDVMPVPTKGGETFVARSSGGAGEDLTSSVLHWNDQISSPSIQEMLMGQMTAQEVLTSTDEYRQKMFNVTE